MEALPKKPVVKKTVAKKLVIKKPKPVKVSESKPTAEVTEVVEPKVVLPKVPHGKSYYAVGRRKTAVAQIMMTAGNGTIMLNLLPLTSYFQTADLQQIAMHPLVTVGLEKEMNIKGKLHGGGIHSQAEAFRHACARALIAFNPESRRTLKKQGFLKRDPRVKERKKPGLKRARRAPQFSKR